MCVCVLVCGCVCVCMYAYTHTRTHTHNMYIARRFFVQEASPWKAGCKVWAISRLLLNLFKSNSRWCLCVFVYVVYTHIHTHYT